MPLYEYKCNKCNEVFEVLQRFSDAPVKVHEGCGGKVKRLLTAPTFQFKGSGFYITDYANKHSSGPSHESNGSDGHNGNGTSKPSTSTPPASATAASKPAPAASASDK
jgi:putative FmdB family regulatory protein